MTNIPTDDLDMIAAAAFVAIAMRETGLSEPRLRGELIRTAVQLRLFADAVVESAYLDVRIDELDANFVLGVRPDLRRYHIPVGRGSFLWPATSRSPFRWPVVIRRRRSQQNARGS